MAIELNSTYLTKPFLKRKKTALQSIQVYSIEKKIDLPTWFFARG